jgi:hypothetical protein
MYGTRGIVIEMIYTSSYQIPVNIFANADWVGWLISLVAVVLAVLFFFKSKATPRLAHQWSGRRLVGGDEAALPDEVTIMYKGMKVPRLSSSLIALWNAGNLTIRGSDIVEADPLRIVVSKDATILRADVISTTRKVNSVKARVHHERQNEVLCSFDYLDSGDGAWIEILHTSENSHPDIVGTIRGLPRGISDWGSMFPDSDRRIYWTLAIVIVLFFLISALSVVISHVYVLSGIYFVLYLKRARLPPLDRCLPTRLAWLTSALEA